MNLVVTSRWAKTALVGAAIAVPDAAGAPRRSLCSEAAHPKPNSRNEHDRPEVGGQPSLGTAVKEQWGLQTYLFIGV